MRMRSKVSIVTMVGAGALLLCALAAIIAFRAQVANASINPPHPDSHGSYVEVALVNTTAAQGEYLSFGVLFHGMLPCDDPDSTGCNSPGGFPNNLEYEYEVRDSTQAERKDCISGSSLFDYRRLSGRYVHWKTTSPVSYRIAQSCPVGSYTIKLIVTYPVRATTLTADTKSFRVVEELPTSTPTPPRGGNQGGGNQGGGNQGGGNQGGGNQGGGNQGGGNQGGGNQGGGNQGGGNQGGGNQGGNRVRQPGRWQPGRWQPGRRQSGRRQPGRRQSDRHANGHRHRHADGHHNADRDTDSNE